MLRLISHENRAQLSFGEESLGVSHNLVIDGVGRPNHGWSLCTLGALLPSHRAIIFKGGWMNEVGTASSVVLLSSLAKKYV